MYNLTKLQLASRIGMMKTVSVYDLRNNLADYLDLVVGSKTNVVVKRFKRPVAMLVPFKADAVSLNKFFGFMKGGETGEALLRRVRRSKKERAWVKRYE